MADLNKLMEEIKSMTVLELNEFVKQLEEEFGVSAAAPVAITNGTGEAAPAEEAPEYAAQRGWAQQGAGHQGR